MTQQSGDAVIGQDTYVIGKIRNARRVDVHGRVDGEVVADHVVVHPTGEVHGSLRADSAEVHGLLQGNAVVRNLIEIARTGRVDGHVRYGRLALQDGGELSADVRNVPPELSGDFAIAVRRGRATRVTTADVTAFDMDDHAAALTFAVSNGAGGFIVLTDAPQQPVAAFTQADLESGRVLFQHDGSSATAAQFDVVVADAAGAVSGAPRTVSVAVLG